MTTLITGFVGLVLAAATTVGVVHSINDSSPRSTSNPAGTSHVVLYGKR